MQQKQIRHKSDQRHKTAKPGKYLEYMDMNSHTILCGCYNENITLSFYGEI